VVNHGDRHTRYAVAGDLFVEVAIQSAYVEALRGFGSGASLCGSPAEESAANQQRAGDAREDGSPALAVPGPAD
jgi:hypothetical protein